MKIIPKSFIGRSNGSLTMGIAVLLLSSVLDPSQVQAQTRNTVTGIGALANNTTGNENTADGYQALYANSDGNLNTAIGNEALRAVSASQNTATGARALRGGNDGYVYNTGSYNTATGFESLLSNKGGSYNVADGWQALYSNSSGFYNTATGARALFANRDGGVNVANGYSAMEANVSGYYNVASGAFALGNNTNGSYNIATGANALYYNTASNNTAAGHQALQNNRTGGNNVALGYQAGNNLTTGSNNIVIGAGLFGKAGEANTTRIGKTTQLATYIGGIYNKTVASGTGVAVRIDSTGKLGTVLSSARYKSNIKPMDKASEAILKLEPVTFRYKQELDPDGVPQFGLIAEQVERIDPNLVVRGEDGRVMTVRYDAVNAMLLNEFLKEHHKVEEQNRELVAQWQHAQKQDTRIEQLQALVLGQQRQIEALTTTVQKVSDQVELSKPATRVVVNNP